MNSVRPIAAALFLLSAACDPKPEKSDKTSGPAVATASAVAAPAIPDAATTSLASLATHGTAVAHFADASAPDASRENRNEVEVSGTVVANGKPHAAILTISTGDCLAGAEALTQLPVNDGGAFTTEFMVKRGSQLTICAFVEGDAGESTLYGKAKGPFRIEGEKEVEFEKVAVELKPGPAKRFARTR